MKPSIAMQLVQTSVSVPSAEEMRQKFLANGGRVLNPAIAEDAAVIDARKTANKEAKKAERAAKKAASAPPSSGPKVRKEREIEPIKVVFYYATAGLESLATEYGKLAQSLRVKASSDSSAAAMSRIREANSKIAEVNAIIRSLPTGDDDSKNGSYIQSFEDADGEPDGKAALQEITRLLKLGTIVRAELSSGVILTLITKVQDPVTGEMRSVTAARKFYKNPGSAKNAGEKALAEGLERPAIELEGHTRRSRLDVYRIAPQIPTLSRRERARMKADNRSIPAAPKLQITAIGLSKEEVARIQGDMPAANISIEKTFSKTIPIFEYRIESIIQAEDWKELDKRPELQPILSDHGRSKAATKKAPNYNRNQKTWSKASSTRNVTSNYSHRSFNWY